MKLYLRMNQARTSIAFLDNTISRIFRTVESLRQVFGEVQVFDQEKNLLEYLEGHRPDVILLNLDLAPNDGIQVLKELRVNLPQSSGFIVIYTDKQDDFVQELALNSGADAFVNFHHKASVMRLFLRNLVRRRPVSEKRTRDPVVIDRERFLVYNSGEPVQLPRKEFRILELLYHQPGRFFTKKEIARLIWNDEMVAERRTIDVHIYNIRQLFGKRIIQSQKGKGYRFNAKLNGNAVPQAEIQDGIS